MRINQPMPTGVRLIDTFCTTGKGQRIGIFGGSGVGKSTLLGMMARGTGADIAVLALIGERGREVREFIEDELGPEGMRRSIIVVATSDEPPLMRLRAALLATRIAEWFADRSADVLLMMDSLTRLAMAQREVGLAAGEPPTARGYTPSVFSLMARLLERAGPRQNGTITGFYTVLVEGDDMNDPIADTARSILDGHLILDRRIAVSGRYPAIDPLASLSRLAPKLIAPERIQLVESARDALAAAEEVRELVEVGAYVAGTNPAADRGMVALPHLTQFMKQSAGNLSGFGEAWESLEALRPVIEGAA
jgi:flagellum-specific ATP synthase